MVGNAWKKTALQVNPYAYVESHQSQAAGFTDEDAYNKAMVDGASNAGVEIVAITDHFTVQHSESLRIAFEAAGIAVLPGFEARASNGVHLLCIFDRSTSVETLHDYITELVGADVDVKDRRDSQCRGDVEWTSELVDKWGGITIAAHALGPKGLLVHLKGTSLSQEFAKMKVSALAVDLQTPSQSQLQLLQDRSLRNEPLATINAADVWEPGFFEKPQTFTWLKLSEECFESSSGLVDSLRQCLLDHELRVCTDASAPTPPKTRLVSAEWRGSPIFGSTTIEFNPGVNVLIGGRGTGKSAALASVAWALDLTTDLNPATGGKGIPEDDLIGGGEVELEFATPSGPVKVRRQCGQEPQFEGEFPGIFAGYGQGELERQSGDQAFRVRLIERFCEGLNEARSEIASLKLKVEDLVEEISRTERKLDESGDVNQKLTYITEQLDLVNSSGLSPATTRLTGFRATSHEYSQAPTKLEGLGERVRGFFAAEIEPELRSLKFDDVDDDPRPADAPAMRDAIASTNEAVSAAFTQLDSAIADGLSKVEKIVNERGSEQTAAEAERRAILDTLDADEARIPALEERRGELQTAARERTERQTRLANLLSDLQQTADELRLAEDAVEASLIAGCRKANAASGSSVIVKPIKEANPDQLRTFLVDAGLPPQNVTSIVNTLLSSEGPDCPKSLVAAIENGESWFEGDGRSVSKFTNEFTTDSAFMRRLATVRLTTSIDIQLIVGDKPKPIDKVSDGQRVTAVLMILLAEGDSPLMIDQPEDDLDNRFIATELVDSLRRSSERQVILSTHNANIAVLGGCDALVEMTFDGDECGPSIHGSIDSTDVSSAVQETLEGGREALAKRQRRYGAL